MQEGPSADTVLHGIEHFGKDYPLWMLFTLVFVVLFPTFVSLLRERHLRKAFEGTIKAQENEIKRLAQDNKDWREHFFGLKGLTEEQVLSQRSESEKEGAK